MCKIKGKTVRKASCCIIILLSLVMAGIVRFEVKAAVPSCETYSGSNMAAQNYLAWSSPITSYLTPCKDGSLMRVQWIEDISKVLVEYYDSGYNRTGFQMLNAELPIFGGFYAADNNYYIFSGQSNPEESDSVEVFRLTKYDKNWNRLGAASLYGANTYIPMDAGSCRMASCGKYILVRTCHEMYVSSDGRHHQANVTIEVDSNTMTVTDSYTGVMNVGYGYVSHSFNQFIAMDGGHIVAVDHGDAYPRSIVLQKYTTDASSGRFTGSAAHKSLLEFYGKVGDNGTGASIGGFEISDTSYLTAGNSIVQDGSGGQTRNIFVASARRSSNGIGETDMQWITNYAEGEESASTPQLVKISNNSFLLLWSREGNVNYTMLDGKGNPAGKIYSIKGSLSDCKPIVSAGKVIWYTWMENINTFYEISLSDLSAVHADVTENGHDYSDISISVTNGVADLTCNRCQQTLHYNVPTSLQLWWKEEDDTSGYYWSYCKGQYEVGDGLDYWYVITDMGTGAPEDNQEIEIIISDESIVKVHRAWNPSRGTFTMIKPGNVSITFRAKYNPDLQETVSITVKGSDENDNEETGGGSGNGSGGTLEGKVMIKGKAAEYVMLKVRNGDKEIPVEVTEDGKYTLSGLADGSYILEAGGENCAAQTYSFVVENGRADPLDIELHLTGDIDGDGNVNMRDLNRICDHIRKKMVLAEYDFKCADITGDGEVNTRDLNRICDHIRKKNPLW